jgi:hypothetical protein
MNNYIQIKTNFRPEELEAQILEHARQIAAQRIQSMRSRHGRVFRGKKLSLGELAAMDPRLRYFGYDREGRRL